MRAFGQKCQITVLLKTTFKSDKSVKIRIYHIIAVTVMMS